MKDTMRVAKYIVSLLSLGCLTSCFLGGQTGTDFSSEACPRDSVVALSKSTPQGTPASVLEELMALTRRRATIHWSGPIPSGDAVLALARSGDASYGVFRDECGEATSLTVDVRLKLSSDDGRLDDELGCKAKRRARVFSLVCELSGPNFVASALADELADLPGEAAERSLELSIDSNEKALWLKQSGNLLQKLGDIEFAP